VSSSRSRYRPEGPADYSHRFHAGNVGDVWKHCALVEVLRRVAARSGRVGYLESHAGEGRYPLGPTGEWTEGVGRLWTAGESELGDGAVARYVALARRLGQGADRPEVYPGSVSIARDLLGPDARITLWERDDAAFARLEAEVAGDRRVALHRGDGWSDLGAAVRAAAEGTDALVVLIDPPFTQKRDWEIAATALAAGAHAVAAAHAATATLLLWYPLKSLTRPNAMHARIEAAGVAATVAELVTTPLEHQRQRLNGSGVVLVRPPAGSLEEIAAAAPVIGRLCAVRGERWSSRLGAW
jgi:23S rRNA (adenine2030-N6)-methyltransferase